MMSSVQSNGNVSEEKLDRILKALSDTTRRSLLSTLCDGPAMVTELASPFDMSLPAIGKHIRVLEAAGLIQRTVRGRVHRCALDASPLAEVDEWLITYRKFWDETLDSLSDYVRNTSAKKA